MATPSDPWDTPEVVLLRPSYLARRQEELRKVPGWIADQSYEQIRRVGHNMKGSGGSYGLFDLSTLGRQLEEAAKSRDDQLIRQVVAEMEESIRRSSALPSQS
jgi:HPt (histidine-containing phosphotransfer) domain-containing protein